MVRLPWPLWRSSAWQTLLVLSTLAVAGKLHRPHYVLSNHVAFDVYPTTRSRATKRCVLPGERNDLNVELCISEVGDRQADPIERDRTLPDEIGCQRRREAHRQPARISVGPDISQCADTVDVSLNQV